MSCCCCSIAWPHGLQHTRLPCPPLSPRAYHPSISSSVLSFSSCPQSFPASGSFPVSQHFSSDGQSIGGSTSTLVSPMNIKGWFPLELTSLISLQSTGLSTVFFNTAVQNHQFFGAQPSLWSISHIHTGKTIALTTGFCWESNVSAF